MNGCSTIEVVNVPGLTGPTGADGTNGQNAFTLLTSPLTLPAANANVTAAVASSLWMAVGQNVVVSDGTNIGNFQVVSFPSVAGVVLKWLNYPGDSVTTSIIAIGATVSPAGLLFTPTNPIPVNQGGTGVATLTGLALGAGTAALTGVQFSTGTFVCNGVTPVNVVNAAVTANSVVIATLKTVGGTVGAVPAVKTITPGTGFTIAGTASDTSTYNVLILN